MDERPTKATTVDRLIPAHLWPVTVDLTGAARTAAAYWGDRVWMHLHHVRKADRQGFHRAADHAAQQAHDCAMYAGTAARLAR